MQNVVFQFAIRLTPIACLVSVLAMSSKEALSSDRVPIELSVVREFRVPGPIGQLRAIPVEIGNDSKGIFVAYSADKDIDPYIEMFYAPTDRVKFYCLGLDGALLWKKEARPCVINGIWFCPFFPFDMDQDGTDEIYYVTNIDPHHLLAYSKFRLCSMDARDGKEIGLWEWPMAESNTLSHTFRNFIMGGRVKGQPVLVTAQGTYGRMTLQGWNSSMSQRWNVAIEAEEPGARGSHQSPIVDINGDGIDDLLWGERCIELNKGRTLWVGDRETYNGHSDVIQPTLNRRTNKWHLFTARESGDSGQIKPRVVMFDQNGERVWTDLEFGHMDMGHTAHVGGDVGTLAFTISRGDKRAGPKGFYRLDVHEFAYQAFSGQRLDLPFAAYNTVPVDLDGDGYHEFARSFGEQADRKVLDFDGNEIGSLGEGAYLAMASKFMDRPGEQVLVYHSDGRIRVWADRNARDSDQALKRYSHPFYEINRRMTANGYNSTNLGGL